MQVQYTDRMAAAVRSASELAAAQRSPELFTIHLLTVLSAQDDSTFSALLIANGVDLAAFHEFAVNRSRQMIPPVSRVSAEDIRPSQEHAGLLEGAATEMAEIGDSRLGTEHLLLAALKYRPGKGAWATFGLSYAPVRKSLDALRKNMSV
ncbi:Clp protease N-terminal domain-containing protein [Streptomyces sp. NPDC006476]|uniref:Clp protease N-terminal domain-containing protein n=1 Tax=Streptomyces sp. NPDC006476 TaxID=3157175 RepID=UPI0033B83C57